MIADSILAQSTSSFVVQSHTTRIRNLLWKELCELKQPRSCLTITIRVTPLRSRQAHRITDIFRSQWTSNGRIAWEYAVLDLRPIVCRSLRPRP